MKKIICIFLIFLCLPIVGCKKNTPAKVTLNDNENYTFNKTSNLEEVKEIFTNLNNVKLNVNFNGVSLKINSNISGLVHITKDELRTVDLNYDLDFNSLINFRKYLLNGTLTAKGYANTESSNLSLKSNLNTKLNVINDDYYLYAEGLLKNKDMSLNLKHKLNIETFTKKYKTYITSFIDLLKYYKITDFLNKDIDYITKYNIIITNTTTDSFTICTNIPSNLGFDEFNINGTTPIYITISCDNLLPVNISFKTKELVTKWLENKYVEQYLSSNVEVKDANLDINLEIKYGYIEVKELKEEEKNLYLEYNFN